MREEFLNHVKNHVMTINNDNGIYRSIHFGKPKSSDRYFNITTWDGHLCISGDMGTYVFRRTNDMFRFFRGESVNLGYWSEKIEAGDYKKYSPVKAREALNYEFEIWLECNSDASESKINDEREKLDEIDTSDYFEFMEAVRDWEPSYLGVCLDDFWEHNLNEYTYHFEWCCHAIVWAIEQYDAVKTTNK